MGTNVYFYRKLNQEQLDEIQNHIAKFDNLPDIKDYVDSLTHIYPNYAKIHVGKRSYGWEFIFSEDIFKLCGEEQINENSIISFLSTGELITEYEEHIPVEYFWREFVDSNKGGYTKESYFKEHPEHRSMCRYDFYVNGLNFEKGEFC